MLGELHAYVEALVSGKADKALSERGHEHPPQLLIQYGLDSFTLHRENDTVVISYHLSSLLLKEQTIESLERASLRLNSAANCFEMKLKSGLSVASIVKQVRALIDAIWPGKNIFFSVALEPCRPPDTSSVEKAMKRLAKRRNHEARRELYEAILNGRLWIGIKIDVSGPVVSSASDEEASRQFSDEQDSEALEEAGKSQAESSRKCWAVYTDRNELLRQFPEYSPSPLQGLVLASAIQKNEIPAIALNFKGTVGGMLLPADLEVLCRAAGFPLRNS